MTTVYDFENFENIHRAQKSGQPHSVRPQATSASYFAEIIQK